MHAGSLTFTVSVRRCENRLVNTPTKEEARDEELEQSRYLATFSVISYLKGKPLGLWDSPLSVTGKWRECMQKYIKTKTQTMQTCETQSISMIYLFGSANSTNVLLTSLARWMLFVFQQDHRSKVEGRMHGIQWRETWVENLLVSQRLGQMSTIKANIFHYTTRAIWIGLVQSTIMVKIV